MTKDNSTGKNKDFYELGKKMFDRLNPHIAHNPKVVGPEQEPVAWMVYTQDGQSVYVTDNPTDIQENQRALPMYTTPPQRKPLSNQEIYKIYRDCGDLNVKINIARAIEAAHGIGDKT